MVIGDRPISLIMTSRGRSCCRTGARNAQFYVLCPMSYVLCPMSYVLCPMSYVLWPMSYVLCPMSYVLRSWLLTCVLSSWLLACVSPFLLRRMLFAGRLRIIGNVHGHRHRHGRIHDTHTDMRHGYRCRRYTAGWQLCTGSADTDARVWDLAGMTGRAKTLNPKP